MESSENNRFVVVTGSKHETCKQTAKKYLQNNKISSIITNSSNHAFVSVELRFIDKSEPTWNTN